MKFQVDAHISTEVVAMIRRLGHDCNDASSIPIRLPDVDLLRQAAQQNRVVVTADKDFGELVFVHRIRCPGVILLRVNAPDEHAVVEHLEPIWPAILSRLPGSFITVTSQSTRVRPIDP
jgi:predicted nuclease of predicted toxin-antitoxin system